jgi:hypothetical protein
MRLFSIIKISFLILIILLFQFCNNYTNNSGTSQKLNLLSELPTEKSHVDSIITSKELPISYITETYSANPTKAIDTTVIPLKSANYIKANDTLFTDPEVPEIKKNVKTTSYYLNPFISFVSHPLPVKSRELRTSSIANTDIQYLNVEQGLPNTNIFDIDEDQNGFLWFSHSNGLTRYDGINFYTYTTKNGLSSNLVYSTLITKNNNFWILSNNGLMLYDGVKFKTYNSKCGLNESPIRDYLLDEEDNLWILHQQGFVGKIKNDTIIYYNEKSGIKNNKTNAIGIDSLNRIFISYEGEMPTIIDKKTVLNYKFNPKAKKAYWFSTLSSFAYRDNLGYLWISNYGGNMIKTSPNTRSQRILMPTEFNYDVTTCMA